VRPILVKSKWINYLLRLISAPSDAQISYYSLSDVLASQRLFQDKLIYCSLLDSEITYSNFRIVFGKIHDHERSSFESLLEFFSKFSRCGSENSLNVTLTSDKLLRAE
jgi:hypothetical protein